MDVFKLMGRIAIDASDAIGEIDSFAKKVNNASKKITTSIGKISHAFTGTIKGLNQIGEVTERAGRRIAQGIAVGAAAVATAAATMGKSALNIRSGIEQGMGGAEAVFQQYAQHIKDSSKDAWKTAGLSVEEYLATANKMGSLFKGAGFSEMQSVEYTANAMQRAADVASIMGISMDSAMESVAGMAKGNFTMMDNLGVAMNDTTLEAYRLEKGLAKSVSTMTTAEKVGLAYEMFMERTADYAGNYAKENETAAGSLQTLKAAWSNFLGGVGTFDDLEKSAFGYLRIAAKTMGLDSLEPMILGAQKTVEEVAEILSMDNLDGRQKIAKVRRLLLEKSISLTSGMGEKIVQGISGASGIISETLSDINVNLPHYIEVGRSIFNSVRDGVKAASSELVNTAEVVSSDAIAAWFTTKTDFITIGLNILGGIARGITDDLAKGEDSTIAASVQEGVGNVMNAIFSNAANAVDALSGLGTLAINTIGAIGTNITTNLEGEKGEELKASIGEGISNLLKATAENLPSLLDAGLSIVTSLGDAVSNNKDAITGGISDVITSITDWLLDPANLIALGEAAINIGGAIVDGTIQGLGRFGAELLTTIGDETLKLIDGLFGTEFYKRSQKSVEMGLTGSDQADYVFHNKLHGVPVNVKPYDQSVPALGEVTEEKLKAGMEKSAEAIIAYTEEADAVSKTLVEQQAKLAEAESNYVEHFKAYNLINKRLKEGNLSNGFNADETELLQGYYDDFLKYFNVGKDGSSEPKLNGSKMQKVFGQWIGDAQSGVNASEAEYAAVAQTVADLEAKLADLQTKIQQAQTAQENASKALDNLKTNTSDAAGDVSGLGDAANGAAQKLNDIHFPIAPVTPNAKGAVFNAPTIFDTRLGRQMVGEAGPEAVAPIAVLQKYVQAAVKSANIERDGVMAELASAIQDLREGFNANMNLYVNKRHVASAMSRDMGRSIGNREYTLMKGMGG